MYSDDNCSTMSDDTISDRLMPVSERTCFECSGSFASDRYMLSCNGHYWHESCLRCCTCLISLANDVSCYFRHGDVYCKNDYDSQFGVNCDKCFQRIHRLDWVRRAGTRTYHLACFACYACKRQLSTGEEFSLMSDKLLCKVHAVEDSGDCAERDGEFNTEDQNSKKKKSRAKRVRTTFTDDQIRVLQANFKIDTNPDGQDLDRIAQITGLSKRVTQVWFQNSRARQKKHRETKESMMGSHDSVPDSCMGTLVNDSSRKASGIFRSGTFPLEDVSCF